MTTMDSDAADAAWVIRQDVPKPDRPPTSGPPWRWDGRCPLGMHPCNLHRNPPAPNRIPGVLSQDYGIPFGQWWDEQKDIEAAIEAVWGSPPDWDRSQLRFEFAVEPMEATYAEV